MNYSEKENNRRWFVIGLLFNLLMIGVYVGTVSTVSNYYNNTTGVTNHSNLTNLQGGLSPDEYYHLNSSFYSTLTGMKECGSSPLYYYALKYIGGSLTCIAIPVDDTTWESSKVNKSGDNMTGTLRILEGIPMRDLSSDKLNIHSITAPSGLILSNNLSTNSLGGYIAGIYGRSDMSHLNEGNRMLSIGGNGLRNDSGISAAATIDFYVAYNWNNTSTPSRFGFRTTPNGSTTRRDMVSYLAEGDIRMEVEGAGMKIKEGTNAKQGTCTMVAGNCLISNTAITSNSRLFYNYQAPCTSSIGTLYEVGRNASVNFTIRNTNLANTCKIAYEIFEPS